MVLAQCGRRAATVGIAALLVVGFAPRLTAQTVKRGELFEITDFRETSIDVSPTERERVIQLTFRIKQPGTYSNIAKNVRLYDMKKREISGGITASLIDGDERTAGSIGSKKYVRDSGSGQLYEFGDFKGLRTYTFYFVLGERFAYAVAEVGNESEMVYAVIPPTANIRDFVSP